MSKDDGFHEAIEQAVQKVADEYGGGKLEDFYVRFRHSKTLTSTLATKRIRNVLEDLRRLSDAL